MQCKELSRNELDLVLLGQISALLSHDDTTNARKPQPRQLSSMAFFHGGVRTCQKSFRKLHGIGTFYKIYLNITHTYAQTCDKLSCTHTNQASTHTTHKHAHMHTHTHAHTTHTHMHACTHTGTHPALLYLHCSPITRMKTISHLQLAYSVYTHAY